MRAKRRTSPTVWTWASPRGAIVHYTATPPGERGPVLVNPFAGRSGRPSYDIEIKRIPKRGTSTVEKPSSDILRLLAWAAAL